MHFMCETFRQYFLKSKNKMDSGSSVVRNAGARTLDDDAQYQNNANTGKTTARFRPSLSDAALSFTRDNSLFDVGLVP